MACEKLTYMEAREKVKKTKKTPTNEDFPLLITDAEEAPFSKGRNETPKSRPDKQQKENKPQQQQQQRKQQEELYTPDTWNMDYDWWA
jgi:hypothetical protein